MHWNFWYFSDIFIFRSSIKFTSKKNDRKIQLLNFVLSLISLFGNFLVDFITANMTPCCWADESEEIHSQSNVWLKFDIISSGGATMHSPIFDSSHLSLFYRVTRWFCNMNIHIDFACESNLLKYFRCWRCRRAEEAQKKLLILLLATFAALDYRSCMQEKSLLLSKISPIFTTTYMRNFNFVSCCFALLAGLDDLFIAQSNPTSRNIQRLFSVEQTWNLYDSIMIQRVSRAWRNGGERLLLH